MADVNGFLQRLHLNLKSSVFAILRGGSRIQPHVRSHVDFHVAVMECAAQGVVESQHVDALQDLLQGLCGTRQLPIDLHELAFKSAPGVGAISSEVRLLCDLSEATPLWTLRHVGGAMRGAGADQLAALVRPSLDCHVSSNALKFLTAIGFRLDYEVHRIGFAFDFFRIVPMRVVVTSVRKIPSLHAIHDSVPLVPGLSLVDLVAPATPESYPKVVEAIVAFAEHLAPILRLSKPGLVTGVVPTASTAAAAVRPQRIPGFLQ